MHVVYRDFLLILCLLPYAIMKCVSVQAAEQSAEQVEGQPAKVHEQGCYQVAIDLAQRAIALDEKVLGPEHPATAAALDLLAELYRDNGAYEKAEPLYRRSLGIYEKTLGRRHPSTATVLNNLALLYEGTGAYAKAERLFERAVAIDEMAVDPEHLDTAIVIDSNRPLLYEDEATAINNMAEMYRKTGAYAKAEPLYKRAIAIREKVLGPKHPDTAKSRKGLAELYRVCVGKCRR